MSDQRKQDEHEPASAVEADQSCRIERVGVHRDTANEEWRCVRVVVGGRGQRKGGREGASLVGRSERARTEEDGGEGEGREKAEGENHDRANRTAMS